MDSTGVLEQLRIDHRASQRLLGVLEARLDDARRGERDALAVMRDVVRREREYCDRVHHAREELMFSRLCARDDGGALAVAGLTHDHDELARRGETLLESLQAWLAGGDEDPGLLSRRVRDFADGLRNHMRKEELRAFTLAQEVLRDEDWRVIAGAFAGATDPLAAAQAPGYGALRAWLAKHGGWPPGAADPDSPGTP